MVTFIHWLSSEEVEPKSAELRLSESKTFRVNEHSMSFRVYKYDFGKALSFNILGFTNKISVKR